MLRLIYILISFAGFILPGLAFAQVPGKAKAGFVAGYMVPDADNTKPRRAWGVTGSAMLNKVVSVDGYYSVADKAVSTGTRGFELSIHGIGLHYHNISDKGDSYYGIRAGLSKVETIDDSGERLVFSPYHWGFAAGYDHNTFSFMTLGFEGSFLSFDDSATTVNSVNYTEDQFRSITFSVTMKFKF